MFEKYQKDLIFLTGFITLMIFKVKKRERISQVVAITLLKSFLRNTYFEFLKRSQGRQMDYNISVFIIIPVI